MTPIRNDPSCFRIPHPNNYDKNIRYNSYYALKNLTCAHAVSHIIIIYSNNCVGNARHTLIVSSQEMKLG